ncbi:MAG: sulfatase-like hydrolase/transferase [Candidatus Hydrogenedentota bacterium]
MNRRNFLKRAGIGTAALGLATQAQGAPHPASSPRPNILVIMADDMGYSDIGCYGSEIDTPNIDALANNGLRFTQFYNNAKCSPTRASLLTGLYAQQAGVPSGPRPLQDCVTIAEALKPAGYNTYMSGKWHLGEKPTDRGFDRYYGLLDGACNFFNPGLKREGEPAPAKAGDDRFFVDGEVVVPFTPEDPDYYTTDAFTDHAVTFLDEAVDKDDPFFLYLAYTAPHYPLHAFPEDIAKYRGKYLKGWDKLRAERYRRMLDMGIIDPKWALAPRDPALAAWEDIEDKSAWDFQTIRKWYSSGMPFENARDADLWDHKMATYAAMIDRMDQNIGRVVDKLRASGQLDNTLILFLSDNGGCAQSNTDITDIPPGPVDSWQCCDPPWANAQNTPFKRYKRWNYEGGISTPLIAHWPARVAPGTMTGQMGHVVDIMATCLELAGADYPDEYAGHPVQPLVGKSLVPVFDGKTREGHDTFCWQFGKHQAIRQGDWKLVSAGTMSWELYNMKEDRTEIHDRAQDMPERAQTMAKRWGKWAREVSAKPRG